MSAWIVSRRMINILVRAAGRCELIEGMSPTECGQMLWITNVLAIETRYPNTVPDGGQYGYPGWAAFEGRPTITDYVYDVANGEADEDQALTTVHSYSYQTSEIEGYEHTKAGVLIARLQAALEARLGTAEYHGKWSLE